MKAVTFAAAAALLGAVHADESTWESWSSEDPKTPEPKTTTPAAETWSEWASTTEKVPEIKTTSSYDPEWTQWSVTSSKPVDPTSKTTSAWEDWKSTTSSKPVDPTSKTTSAWEDWKSTTSSKPAVVTSKGTDSWSEWKTKETIKSTRTEVVYVTVYDDSWESWSSKPVVSTKTGSWSEWQTNTCQVQISYGEPVWKPTPDAKPQTQTWSEWASTTSTPAKVTVTSSSTWADWSSTKGADVKTQDQGNKFYAQSSSTKSGAVSQQTWASAGSGVMTGVKGDKYGMTYSPYDANSNCKSQDVVDADMKALAALGFGSVRVYSTDCKTLEYVGAACKKYGLKIILGIFISETGISGAQPQVDAIVAWKQWDLVELIVVGNEAVFNKRCDAQALLAFIISSKSAFKGAGYTGYVSTTDELSVWQSYGSAWCDAVDVVTANLYAFFNPNTKAEDAGTFIQAQLNDLAKICPGKQVYAMECGWPSAGQCNGVACPSPENQATAIKSIQATVGAKIVYFSYEDEAWKTAGQFGVEQHWGAGDVFANGWSSWQ